RLAAPGVLAAIEAGPAAQEEDGHADVGVDAEQEAFEVIHGSTPRGSSGAVHLAPAAGPRPGGPLGTAKRSTIAAAAEHPGAPDAPPRLASLKVTGASSQVRSRASGVSSGVSAATVSCSAPASTWSGAI